MTITPGAPRVPAESGRHHADREDPEPDMAAHDDDPIAGRYRRLNLIGQGSFGEVWRVWDTELEQEMAVKILIPLKADATDPDAAEEDRQRFWLEATETWKFRGRNNIVLVYNYGEHRGRPFLVMEFMHGETLRDLLSDGARLEPPQALEILREVAVALGEAHRARLVHRDVKPANIFVWAGNVTLLDFGMLGSIDEGRLRQLTARGQFGGTLEYMAPERWPGDDYSPPETPRSPPGDIYSLACVFYQCLTGALPFDGNDVFELRWQHRHGARPLPGEVDRGLTYFNDIVRRGLAVDPAARPQTAAEFVAGANEALISWLAENRGAPATRKERSTPAPLRPTAGSKNVGGPGTEPATVPGTERPTRPPSAEPPMRRSSQEFSTPVSPPMPRPGSPTEQAPPAGPTAPPSDELPTEHQRRRDPNSHNAIPPEPPPSEQLSKGAPLSKRLPCIEGGLPVAPVLVGGATTGIVGAGAVLLVGPPPILALLAIAVSWAAGACAGWSYGSR